MTPLVIIGLLAGIPIAGAIIMRVNAIVLFTSVAVGNFLVLYLSDDVILAVNAFTKAPEVPVAVKLLLLLAPVYLSLHFMRKTIGHGAFFTHLIPIIGGGLSLALLALLSLSPELQAQVFGLPGGNVFKNSQDLIFGITAVMVLLLMWNSNKSQGAKHSKKH